MNFKNCSSCALTPAPQICDLRPDEWRVDSQSAVDSDHNPNLKPVKWRSFAVNISEKDKLKGHDHRKN